MITAPPQPVHNEDLKRSTTLPHMPDLTIISQHWCSSRPENNQNLYRIIASIGNEVMGPCPFKSIPRCITIHLSSNQHALIQLILLKQCMSRHDIMHD